MSRVHFPWLDASLVAHDVPGQSRVPQPCLSSTNALQGCRLRECWFEPTFHKHAGKLCAGVQIHVEDGAYDHEAFRPWWLMALAFKALRRLRPDYELWRDFPYETSSTASPST